MTDDLTHYMEATSRLSADLTAAQQEIERLGGQLTTEASLTASWIEQCERYKVRAETAEADADRERELGKSHFTRAISAEAALEDVEAERDKLREALAHVNWYIECYGKHSLTSCPPNTRQMCLHADVLTPTE